MSLRVWHCGLLQEDGKWNKFGGRLAWDKSYICNNNPSFGGTGCHKPQEDYVAAPNLDHSQERVRKDITAWMKWLRNNVGFDGWRFDFVKGYGMRPSSCVATVILCAWSMWSGLHRNWRDTLQHGTAYKAANCASRP